MKKTLITIFMFLFCASLLSAQSLFELSKREKERRAKLKGKRAAVVTNADLRRVIRTSGVIIVPPALPEAEAQVEGEQQPAAQEAVLPETEQLPEVTEESQAGPDILAALEMKWKKAIEHRELLNIKMNALWQEFNSMDDMTPREDIQKEMAETSKLLEQAQKDEEKAKREYDLFRNTRG
jgi:hypothetical protein